MRILKMCDDNIGFGLVLTKDYRICPFDFQKDVLKIADDFTLFDLFKMVNTAEKEYPWISMAFGMFHFEAFWEQILKPRDFDDDDILEFLQLSWSPSYESIKEPRDPSIDTGGNEFYKYNFYDDLSSGEMQNLMTFDGYGMSEGIFQAHAIDFCSVNNLKHLPITLNNIVKFRKPYRKEKEEISSTGFSLKIDPTLWCVIASVFWELTFYSQDPGEIQEKMKEIGDSIDEIQDELDKEFDDEN